jgi:hypothetical protein
MLLTGVSSHAAELYLLATNRSNLGERAIEVLLKQVANGVGLDADSLNLMDFGGPGELSRQYGGRRGGQS